MKNFKENLAVILFLFFLTGYGVLACLGWVERTTFAGVMHDTTVSLMAVFLAYLQPPTGSA